VLVCVLIQKLSQFSCYQQACDDDDDAIPWLWTVLDQQTAAAASHSQGSDQSTVLVEARVLAFFRLMIRLPSTAIVMYQRSATLKVCGLAQLRNAVNDLARNTIDCCMLPADMTLHLVLTLASLPADADDELRRFLSDCPLIMLSMLYHFSNTHSGVANLVAQCGNAVMADWFTTISAAVDEARTLLDGGSGQPSQSSAWLRAAALWNRIRSINHSIDQLRQLRTDSETAAALVLWLTVDLSASMLRGDRSDETVVEDAALAVWCNHVNALRCLSDDSNSDQSSQSLSVDDVVFRRCVPDILQSIHPLVCLHLFTRAVSSGARFLSDWDMSHTLHWYTRCAQMFDSGQCVIMTIVMLLQQASQAICSFIPKMSASQLHAIDQETLDALDPHIRILLQQFRNS